MYTVKAAGYKMFEFDNLSYEFSIMEQTKLGELTSETVRVKHSEYWKTYIENCIQSTHNLLFIFYFLFFEILIRVLLHNTIA